MGKLDLVTEKKQAIFQGLSGFTCKPTWVWCILNPKDSFKPGDL